jgi:hypothetical protein
MSSRADRDQGDAMAAVGRARERRRAMPASAAAIAAPSVISGLAGRLQCVAT